MPLAKRTELEVGHPNAYILMQWLPIGLVEVKVGSRPWHPNGSAGTSSGWGSTLFIQLSVARVGVQAGQPSALTPAAWCVRQSTCTIQVEGTVNNGHSLAPVIPEGSHNSPPSFMWSLSLSPHFFVQTLFSGSSVVTGKCCKCRCIFGVFMGGSDFLCHRLGPT